VAVIVSSQHSDNKQVIGVNCTNFIKNMREQWREYKLEPSPALEEAWWQLANTFNRQITDAPENNWAIIPMPTGTGKTTGLERYCALMAKSTVPIGILIVTEFKPAANKLRDNINKLAGSKIATSYHGDNKAETASLCNESPVLIVTHSAFKRIMAAEANDKKYNQKWNLFLKWNGEEQRKLIVIDEVLNFVEHISLTPEDLMLVRATLPLRIRAKFKNEVTVLNAVIIWLLSRCQQADGAESMIVADDWNISTPYDFNAVVEALGKSSKEAEDSDTDKKIRLPYQEYVRVLSGLQFILSNWAHFVKVGDEYRLTSAYVVLPEDIRSLVVLDATAHPNRLYRLLCGIPEYKALPDNIRNYRNVTLRVFWGHSVGKTALINESPADLKKNLDKLAPYLSKDNQVLFCTHKAIEPRLEKLRKKYKTSATMHWGDIAGNNDWNDYDSIVIYGLPFLDKQMPKNALKACIDWHDKTDGKYEVDIDDFDEETNTLYSIEDFIDEEEYAHNEYATGHIITSLVQAINRVRCRRVVDNEGGCDPTNIFLFLNNSKQCHEVLDGVESLMPHINVIHSGNEKAEPKCRDEDKLVKHLSKLAEGKHDAGKIQSKLKISDTTMRRLVKQINGQSSLRQRLDALNITYAAKRGKGGYKVFIIGESGGN
jgi:hypothetical protein